MSKLIRENLLLKFTGGKTKYIINNVKEDYFDAMRVTTGSKAMLQPISIRVKVLPDNKVAVTNLNNKKTVIKQGFTTRQPNINEIKGALKNNKHYKTMKPLESWTTNRKYSL